jgi:hypothetical protein
MATQLELLLEAEKRGLLDAERSRALQELKRREVVQGTQVVERPPEGPGGMAFLNQRIAQGLGAPVDLANVLMGIDKPFLGSESIQSGMEAIGVRFPEQGARPQTLVEHVGSGVGTGAGMALPVGGAVSTLSKSARPLVQKVAKSIQDTMVRSPWLTGISELFAGGGAGVGRKVGEEKYPDNPAVQALFELGFGLGIATAPTVTKTVLAKTPVIGMAGRAAKKAVVPFTKAGGRERAAARVRGLAEDPEAAALAIEQGGPLTPATRTGDRNLMALEKSVLKTDAKLEGRFRQERTETVRNLRREIQEMGGGGQISATRQFATSRMDRILSALDARLKQVATLSKQRVSKIEPSRRPMESSAIVREEIEAALKAARVQEKDEWTKIPSDSLVDVNAARAQYSKSLGELSRAQRDTMPSKAKEFLDPESNAKFADKETVKEMHGLYSALREEARAARSAGERNKARIADDIADSILDDLGAKADDTTEIGQVFKEAIQFSRLLNQKFHRGAVGRLLGYAREGGAAVPEQLTLQKTTGRLGPAGTVATEEILAATGKSPQQTQAAIKEFLRSEFVRKAAPKEVIDSSRAQKFFSENQELLDLFPTLRTELAEAKSAQDVLATRAATTESRKRGVQSPSTSRAAKFLNTKIDDEIAGILKSDDPQAFATELVRQAAKDQSGEAAKGLKGGFIDFLLQKAARTTRGDDFGEVISGGKLLGALENPKIAKMADVFLSAAEKKRLVKIGQELSLIDRSQGQLDAIGKPMADFPNTIIHLIGTTLGARSGAQLGAGTSGASLKMSAYLSKLVDRTLGGLTNDTAGALLRDAIDDPDLFAALLRDPTTIGGAKDVNAKLNAWIVGVGRNYLDVEEEN